MSRLNEIDRQKTLSDPNQLKNKLEELKNLSVGNKWQQIFMVLGESPRNIRISAMKEVFGFDHLIGLLFFFENGSLPYHEDVIKDIIWLLVEISKNNVTLMHILENFEEKKMKSDHIWCFFRYQMNKARGDE